MDCKSYWIDGKAKSYESLENDIETEICVIGGGLAGLSCAYELALRGHKVCVFEADKVGAGNTQRSSAIITFAHDLIYDRLIKKHGIDTAKEYLRLQTYGLSRVKQIIESENIDCDYKEQDFILYAETNKGAKEIDNEYAAYEDLGYNDCQYTTENELGLQIKKAIKISNQAILNPYKFIQGLAKACVKRNVRIFENARAVDAPNDKYLKINGHIVKADCFIVATHFPYINVKGLLFLKMYQHRSHNMVFETDLRLSNAYESAEDKGFEFRQADDRVLVGGANIRTGKYKRHSQYRIVEECAHRLGLTQEVARFSAQDCMTFDYLSYAGNLGTGAENLYVVSGFNKWGFTNAFACAEIIASLIDKNIDDSIFSPQRGQFFNAPLSNLANVAETAANFFEYIINTEAKPFTRIKEGQGAIVRHKGKRLGVYRDENGLHVVNAVCAHLGCALRWNKDELSWDCACHGSRYDIHGNPIDSPTVKPLEKIQDATLTADEQH